MCFFVPLFANSQGIEITSGGKIEVTGAASIEIIDGSFTNDGTYTKGTETVTMSGTTPKSLLGSAGFNINNLVINSTGVISAASNLTVEALSVNPNAKLTLNTGKSLVATNLNLLCTSGNQTGTFVNLGNVNATNVSVQKYLETGRNWYISSPVKKATSNVFSANTLKPLYWYDEANGSSATLNWPKITNTTTDLVPMRGYLCNLAGSGIVTFPGNATDSLNSGNQSTTVNRTTGQLKAGFNLVGNPYPSYVNIRTATRTNLGSTYWYRSRNAANTAYIFDTYNIAMQNGISLSGKSLTNYIPPLQAFWLQVDAGKSDGTLSFINTDLSHQDISNNIFRIPGVQKSNENLLRLMITDGTNNDEALIYTNSSALLGYDIYDSPKMTNANSAIPEIYTKAITEKLAINGMNEFPLDTEIPLFFTSSKSENYSISATESRFYEVKAILLDKLTAIQYEINSGFSHEFTSVQTTDNNRFSLIFKPKNSPSAVEITDSDNEILIYNGIDNKINVLNKGSRNNLTINVYNALGQKLISNNANCILTTIDSQLKSGVYLVQVSNSNFSYVNKIKIN